MNGVPNVVLLLLAALSFTVGGICMKHSDGLTKAGPSVLLGILFLLGAGLQALAMRRYSDWLGQRPTRVLVTGGASANVGILRVVSDVLQARLVPLQVSNASALATGPFATSAFAPPPR